MRKAVYAIIGGALLLVGVAACHDDPLSENRDEAAYFFTNPTVANVKVNDSTKVTAIVMNDAHSPIGAAVTGEPCDAKISVAKDATRTAYESPERFVVRGVAAGASCLVVSGGGIRDTVTVTIVP